MTETTKKKRKTPSPGKVWTPALIGPYLEQCRKAKGLSQEEVSGLIGNKRSKAKISRFERNEKIPSDDTLELLGPVLGVDGKRLIAIRTVSDSKAREWAKEDQWL